MLQVYVQFGMVGVKYTITLFSSLSTEMLANYRKNEMNGELESR